MKLEKNWYSAAAREIVAELSAIKNTKQLQEKKEFEDNFWTSEDGLVIQALQDKYNTSCNIKSLSFNMDNYRTSSGLMKPVYSIPHSTTIEDKLRLLGVNAEDSVKLLSDVKNIFLQRQQEFYNNQE